jgi:hypothetical protein
MDQNIQIFQHCGDILLKAKKDHVAADTKLLRLQAKTLFIIVLSEKGGADYHEFRAGIDLSTPKQQSGSLKKDMLSLPRRQATDNTRAKRSFYFPGVRGVSLLFPDQLVIPESVVDDRKIGAGPAGYGFPPLAAFPECFGNW